MLRSAWTLLLVAVLVVSVGCTTGLDARTVDAPAAPPAQIHQRWPGCDALGAFVQPQSGLNIAGVGSMPAGYHATAAIYCQTGLRTLPNQTEVQRDLERRATSIEPLLRYLARPSQRSRNRQLACAAMGWIPPWLFITDDAGRWIAPRLPTDPCGFPLGTFDDAHPPAYLQLHYSNLVVHQRKQPK